MQNIFEAKNFSDLFGELKQDDVLVIVGHTATHWGQIENIQGGDVGIEILGSDYILNSNSFDNDILTVYNVTNKNSVRIQNIDKLILKRNGVNVDEFSSDPSKNTSNPTNNSILPFYQDAYNNIMSELTHIETGSKLIVKTGTLDSNDKIDPDTISEIDFEVIEQFSDGTIRAKMDITKGVNTYNELKNVFIKISPTKSISIDQNGIKMEVITMKKPFKHIFIPDIFDIEVGAFTKKSSVTLDDLQADKTFRDLYNKNPSLFGSLMGQGPVGIYQINKLMDKYKLSTGYNTKNGKVKFLFNGKNLATGTNINLLNNEEYIGIFDSSRSIKMITNKRNISILIKLDSEVKSNTYAVVIYKNNIINGQSKLVKIGDGSVKILDKNFR